MGVPFSPRSYGREGQDQIRADGDSVHLVLGKFRGCTSERTTVVPATVLRGGHDEVAWTQREQSAFTVVYLSPDPQRPPL